MANGDAMAAHYGCVLGHLMNNSYRLGSSVPFNSKAGGFSDNSDASEHFLRLHEIMSEGVGVPENGSTYIVGPSLTYDPKTERHIGEFADRRVGKLSMGQKQRVSIARTLVHDPKVIIFDEPTRGIDVGAKSEIYGLMHKLAEKGVAIIMVSSDMEEVIGVSDRVAVMYQGLISGILKKEDFTEENIMQLAVGNIQE